MNFNQLKIFYTVASEKSFSLAAKHLFLTQPDVSIQIRLLEDSFGIKLIERIRKDIKLTDAGVVLYSYAKRIFELSQEAETLILDYKTLRQGILRVWASTTTAKCYIPQILSDFKTNYPSIKIILKAGNSREAVDRLLNFELDIAIIGRIDYGDKLSFVPFITNKLVLITSFKDDLCKQKKIDLKDLIGKPIIIREVGSALREFILKIFESEKIPLNIIMELGNCDAIKKMVENGIGLSFMTYNMVKEEVEKGILRVIDFPIENFKMNFDIVYHKNRRDSNLIKIFINSILKMAPKIKELEKLP